MQILLYHPHLPQVHRAIETYDSWWVTFICSSRRLTGKSPGCRRLTWKSSDDLHGSSPSDDLHCSRPWFYSEILVKPCLSWTTSM
ncbi:hypothetical protein IGI04_027568 [Brassica rapa subsp. trilocularis]|uniref:Uncharacterized protein n=1 Tax=Brassica rapa subsp. trilocularis TaxID=1813537 RepID=A0ABQ7KZG5_BRACM|nr:hypothetical protein IGI04_027568 [Brassica rapa subsp. trilocularis]